MCCTFSRGKHGRRSIGRPIQLRFHNGRSINAYPDCRVSSEHIYFREPGSRELAFVRSRVRGGVLIDIGANVGSFSLAMADQVEMAVVFEPNPAAAGRAAENFQLNQLPFEVHEVALSITSGDAYLEDRGGVDTTNMLVSGPDCTRYLIRRVARTTLDEFLRHRGPLAGRITCIKIDVEGHELDVLRGMQRTLQSERLDVVTFEYLFRSNFDLIQEELASSSYGVFAATDHGFKRLSAAPGVRPNLFGLRLEAGR